MLIWCFSYLYKDIFVYFFHIYNPLIKQLTSWLTFCLEMEIFILILLIYKTTLAKV